MHISIFDERHSPFSVPVAMPCTTWLLVAFAVVEDDVVSAQRGYRLLVVCGDVDVDHRVDHARVVFSSFSPFQPSNGPSVFPPIHGLTQQNRYPHLFLIFSCLVSPSLVAEIEL
jgi:hypothetical protein